MFLFIAGVSGHPEWTNYATAIVYPLIIMSVVVAVLVMTRAELVRVPSGVGLTEAQARTFADLLLRVGFVVCLLGAVLLVARAVRRLLRIRELIAA